MPDTVSDHVVQLLTEWGVDTVFGLPGDGINGLVEAFRKAADGSATSSAGTRKRPRWPRAATPSSPASSAYASPPPRPAPCICSTGCTTPRSTGPGAGDHRHDLSRPDRHALPAGHQPGLSLPGRGALQPAADGAGACRKRRQPRLPRRAVQSRRSAHVAIPIDFQAMPASQQRRFKRNVPGHTSAALPAAGAHSRARPDRAAAQAARRAREGRDPRRRRRARRRPELEQVAEKPRRPNHQGRCSARTASPTTALHDRRHRRRRHAALRRTRSRHATRCSSSARAFPYIEFLPKPGQAVGVQIDDKPEHIGLRYPVDIGLVGDCKATLARTARQAAPQRGPELPRAGAEGHAGVVGADGGARHEPTQADVSAGASPGTCLSCLPMMRSSAAIPAP